MTNKYDIDVDKLIDHYGSPLFIFSGSIIRANVKAFTYAFSTKYPKVAVAYSYKVNSLPEVLKLIHVSGAWAEVASGFEYEIAQKLGVPNECIVFNGPFKTKEQIRKAIVENALINVDHFDEIGQIEEIASELGKKVDIGIRLNMEVGIDQLPDRFGFNLESGEALEVVSRCSEKGLLDIVGLHVHITSYIVKKESENCIPAKTIELIWPKDHEAYGRAAEKLVKFATQIKQGHGINIKYLDMGGGFPTVDQITPYVDAIVKPILDGFEYDELPLLVLEPGRAIVSDAADLITTIVAQKKLSGGQRAIVVDAGVNILPTSFWKFQEMEYLGSSDSDLEETIIYGPLCLQTDIISKTKLPELKAGDKLLVKNVGAYNIPQSSTFIYPRPVVLLLDENGAIIIKQKDQIESLF